MIETEVVFASIVKFPFDHCCRNERKGRMSYVNLGSRWARKALVSQFWGTQAAAGEEEGGEGGRGEGEEEGGGGGGGEVGELAADLALRLARHLEGQLTPWHIPPVLSFILFLHFFYK